MARNSPAPQTAKREDPRVLVTMDREGRLNRPQPYTVRQALVEAVTGLDSAAQIPKIEPTRTGWAITPATTTARDLLVSPEGETEICRALGAISVKRPVQWHTYAVQDVPSSFAATMAAPSC
ncbi:hypothetical protein N7461_009102 [Penicillium sp. DV-2018c]|nr:hypothetical protein N7461_009102 [Penicillium sp. DV-2018c]